MSEIKMEYFAKGFVLGLLWDGSEATYPIQGCHKANTLENLKQDLVDILADRHSSRTLTHTRDFSLELGALLYISCIKTAVIEGDIFTCEQNLPSEFIGDLTEEQQELLERTDDFY